MKAVRLEKAELLEIIRTNKEKHITEAAEAIEDYKEVVMKIAYENMQLAETRNMDSISKMKHVPVVPQSYEDEYARAIRMFELSVDDVILLEADAFNQLVLDEWHWKSSFDLANSTYKSLL